MRPVNLLQLIVVMILPIAAQALSTDRNQLITIEADHLDIDDMNHISTYQGNVEMRQGSLHIRADKIIFRFNQNNDLQQMDISGLPALFNQLNNQQELIKGSADQMIYLQNDSLLKLRSHAKIQSIEDTIESDQITINTETNALQAGEANSTDRVRMVIQPHTTSLDGNE